MEITITVDERLMRAAAEQAIAATFKLREGSYGGGGSGTNEVHRQAVEWAKAQDYTPLIKELAPRLVKEAVAQSLASAITAAVKAEIKRMRDDGELGAVITAEVKGHWTK